MQAINNNSYFNQGIKPNTSNNQAQVHMPKPPVADLTAQNQYQTSGVQMPQAQQMQAPQMPAPQAMQMPQAQQVQTVPQQAQQAQTELQQTQAQTMPIYPQGVNIPAGGAVNINIFNPTTTNGAPIYPQNTYYSYPATTYSNYMPQNNMTVPQMPLPANAYPAAQDGQTNVQMPQPQQMQAPQAPQAMQMPAPQQMQAQNTQDLTQAQATSPQTPAPEQKAEQKAEQKTENTVPLTNEYIQNLERTLNDGDPKVRLAGATELLKRFKESDERKSDPALTALLNKSLKDPSASVRQMALTILNVGYAIGNEETIATLNNIQANKSDTMYAEDAVVAKEILLKLSGQMQQAAQNAPAQA